MGPGGGCMSGGDLRPPSCSKARSLQIALVIRV